ncbi:MAG TPA: ABC transporter ATP-binding protein [Microthrixaceae bacterium]|nr:ABC transporter ATP-binding protein [Microthrixaceae bacterium]HMT23572.1 ABC transporter ATP-binding protein [Microthrixaceae bacterium]
MTTSLDMATADATVPAVAMSGITKRFPGVIANHDVDFEVAVGEVHALLGENGAGKSTLSNVLTGLYHPDGGEIRLAGEVVRIGSPREALARGIGMVHQHFRLVPTFTVAENVMLGHTGRFNRRAAEERVAEIGEAHGLPVDPSAKIWQLSVGQQQRVEILKALERDARVLILDEPTAVLTPQEAEALFVTLRRMAAGGRSVIFISHKLDEVMAVSDRVTVLRDGTDVGVVEVATTSARDLARLMVGRDVVFNADDGQERASVDAGRIVLRVRDLCAADNRGRPALNGVDLDLAAGEIVAVVGVSGNGQRELAEAICGTRRRTGGTVEVDGQPTSGRDPREMIAKGVSHVPEDRLHTGLSPSASIEENLVLKSYRRPPISAGPFVRRRAVRRNAETLIERFGVKTTGPTVSTRLLSGGNVQKVLLAREFSAAPKVLVAASPTRGLDVGAIETVRGLLLDASRSGTAVLLITEELDEALALADRVAVIYEGRIVGVVDRASADLTEIGLLMGGGRPPAEEL